MAKAKSQLSLDRWTKQKWRTKSGKKSSETGERYLPDAAIKALSDEEYAATTRKKRKDTKKNERSKCIVRVEGLGLSLQSRISFVQYGSDCMVP